ncbi:inositol monophosphatase family protein [Foetidibacter luteolus]|uniref:inositol monophosphatase family protein n=1 Tax=Foetidibacter luteolus TaxID=2608880 RepID=UPI00129B495C|nr:inositol monophosphatase family protein [Foetidibacter luteolus]
MSYSNWENDLLTAVNAAKEAGKILLAGKNEVTVNSSINKDIKLEADIISEKLIIDLLSIGTDYYIISEEQGVVKQAKEGYCWIVDPLDGSLNYSRGIEINAVSIGLWNGNEPVLGVIYDFLHDKLYKGVVGIGAWCNDEPISVSKKTMVEDSIIATGFSVYSDYDQQTLESFIRRIQGYKKVRLFGSAAVSLIYVAKGSIEAYQEDNIAIWDVAAGLAIILAAGGKVDIKEGKGSHYLNVYASNGQ